MIYDIEVPKLLVQSLQIKVNERYSLLKLMGCLNSGNRVIMKNTNQR